MGTGVPGGSNAGPRTNGSNHCFGIESMSTMDELRMVLLPACMHENRSHLTSICWELRGKGRCCHGSLLIA